MKGLNRLAIAIDPVLLFPHLKQVLRGESLDTYEGSEAATVGRKTKQIRVLGRINGTLSPPPFPEGAKFSEQLPGIVGTSRQIVVQEPDELPLQPVPALAGFDVPDHLLHGPDPEMAVQGLDRAEGAGVGASPRRLDKAPEHELVFKEVIARHRQAVEGKVFGLSVDSLQAAALKVAKHFGKRTLRVPDGNPIRMENGLVRYERDMGTSEDDRYPLFPEKVRDFVHPARAPGRGCNGDQIGINVRQVKGPDLVVPDADFDMGGTEAGEVYG